MRRPPRLSFVISGCSCSSSASEDDGTASIVIGFDSEIVVFSIPSPSTRAFGGLIQTAVGSGRGDGRPSGNLCSERTFYRVLAENIEVRERRDQLRHPH